MTYMLDTNICIALIRQRSPALEARVRSHSIPSIAVSSVTVAELYVGVEKSSRPSENRQALEYFLIPLTILDFDYDAALVYGRVRARLEHQGRPIGSLDTMIAAHALSQDMTLVTNNVREFSRVDGLSVEDWTQT